jgi:hypothetical protein
MYQNIEIIIEKDELNREIYRFIQMEFDLILNLYKVETRETKRKKFKRTKWYDRLRERDCTIKKQDVILTDEIKQMAYEKLINLYKENLKVKL